MIVPNGAANLLSCPHTNRFKTKKIANEIPGKNNADNNALVLHDLPENNLYIRDEWYPLNTPANINNNTAAVIKPPRFAGDRKPKLANTTIAIAMVSI